MAVKTHAIFASCVQCSRGTHRIWTLVCGWSSTAQHEREGVGVSGQPLKTSPARRTGTVLRSGGAVRPVGAGWAARISFAQAAAAFSPPDALTLLHKCLI